MAAEPLRDDLGFFWSALFEQMLLGCEPGHKRPAEVDKFVWDFRFAIRACSTQSQGEISRGTLNTSLGLIPLNDIYLVLIMSCGLDEQRKHLDLLRSLARNKVIHVRAMDTYRGVLAAHIHVLLTHDAAMARIETSTAGDLVRILKRGSHGS